MPMAKEISYTQMTRLYLYHTGAHSSAFSRMTRFYFFSGGLSFKYKHKSSALNASFLFLRATAKVTVLNFGNHLSTLPSHHIWITMIHSSFKTLRSGETGSRYFVSRPHFSHLTCRLYLRSIGWINMYLDWLPCVHVLCSVNKLLESMFTPSIQTSQPPQK